MYNIEDKKKKNIFKIKKYLKYFENTLKTHICLRNKNLFCSYFLPLSYCPKIVGLEGCSQ